MEYWYLVAATDEDAAATVDWPRGPFGSLDADQSAVVLATPVRGPQFSQQLAELGKTLLGWRHDLESPEHKLAVSSNGQLSVVAKVPADLVTALATIEDIDEIAERWATAAGFETATRARSYLDDLCRLAWTALQTSTGLYSFSYT
ncbi:hypothetical protein GCM10012287_52820 [Streptomyces daqingensis]|uniref:Uncharacterized protein n=1 Tax=Streptomyces daqingensis TaxID=1472640 RepID=A0ABQ2MT09_9ACTN|nr:hypothetical protein [Streptomyces daqingensis]GGO57287.1 hypothetical protein GCM10012287_52820 [Streptomyces daqingensis]